MSLPYRWYPSGTVSPRQHSIVVGTLIAHDHAVWRVINIRDLPEVDWSPEDHEAVASLDHCKPEYRERTAAHLMPRVMTLRPNRAGDDPRDRDLDKHYLIGGRTTLHWGHDWAVYPDQHYPVCAACQEPLPCREQMAEQVSAASATRMGRYEMEGVCPACQEPVTARQKSWTWPDNVEIPGGPSVTFHQRGMCRGSATGYETRWVAADPARRRAFLTCPGHVINHNDGTFQCSELTECPGPQARHPSYTVCRCPDCHARGPFGCTPSQKARNQALDGDL